MVGVVRRLLSGATLPLFLVFVLIGSVVESATASTVWTFDLPATATSSQDPPYETVATLTLTQTTDGVQFVLDPNESSSGYTSGGPSFIERLDYVYSGAPLATSDFRIDDGAIDSFSFESNPNDMDAGYQADVFHIVVDFPSRNDPDRFLPDQTRTWTVLGTTIDQFRDTFATSPPKPTPIAGVLSVTGYALDSPKPTPSNWVAGTVPVPEPGTFTLVMSGLGLLAWHRSHRRESPSA